MYKGIVKVKIKTPFYNHVKEVYEQKEVKEQFNFWNLNSPHNLNVHEPLRKVNIKKKYVTCSISFSILFRVPLLRTPMMTAADNNTITVRDAPNTSIIGGIIDAPNEKSSSSSSPPSANPSDVFPLDS